MPGFFGNPLCSLVIWLRRMESLLIQTKFLWCRTGQFRRVWRRCAHLPDLLRTINVLLKISLIWPSLYMNWQRKYAKFEWNERRQKAFESLKYHLTHPPVLAMPRDEGEYVLDTDCSDVAASAVLSQIQDGEERVIAYSSRTLSKSEQLYCITRKELLAVVNFVKHYRCYLVGRQFRIRTDHAALQYLHKSVNLLGQSARWLQYLEEFNY